MGAKQSKRSVDISGKEAEGASEVAAAGAGGEGRVEPLADADALKPQVNGDAHIQPPNDQSEKEKQLDSGTPENEKDATTEKESKEEANEKEIVPVTNGESEPKAENGESSPITEDGKKPKKEKVKKKWSLRSISFSRKDKPKQEKKQKEEESKTNGEPEKVPEEAAEATPEIVETKIVEETKPEAEAKDEKIPETPVTEPITNGSNTPESPPVVSPATEDLVTTIAANDRPECKAVTEPEQLPVNGLSLQEDKKDTEVTENEETKLEKPTAEATETVPAPEIPVIKEVCVEQMPLIEPTPPPLPANPPPSSVVSFAATTMAPELTDASLANTTEIATSALPANPGTCTDEITTKQQNTHTNTIDEVFTTEILPPFKEIEEEKPVEMVVSEQKGESEEVSGPRDTVEEANIVRNTESEKDNEDKEIVKIDTTVVITTPSLKSDMNISETIDINKTSNIEIVEEVQRTASIIQCNTLPKEISNENISETIIDSAKVSDIVDVPEDSEDLPLPPPPADDVLLDNNMVELESHKIQNKKEIIQEAPEAIVDSNHILNNSEVNGIDKEGHNGKDNETEQENIKNKTKDSLGNVIGTIECNGNIDSDTLVKDMMAGDEKEETTPEESMPQLLSKAVESTGATGAVSGIASDSLPPLGSELSTCAGVGVGAAAPTAAGPALDPEQATQEPIPVSDKLADLIPEIPTVPELKTETESAADVAVAN